MNSRNIILLIILLSGIVVVFYITRHEKPPDITEIKPLTSGIELSDTNENKLMLDELKGSVIFINFWASWCPPCIDEMPIIEQISRNLSGNSKFKLITILYREDKEKALRYLKENSYTFPVYTDSAGSAAKRFGVTGVPETYIIDKKGNLRERVIGPLGWDSTQTIEICLKLINE